MSPRWGFGFYGFGCYKYFAPTALRNDARGRASLHARVRVLPGTKLSAFEKLMARSRSDVLQLTDLWSIPHSLTRAGTSQRDVRYLGLASPVLLDIRAGWWHFCGD